MTVIDVTAATAAGARLQDRTVLISGTRIQSVLPAAQAVLPDGAVIVEGDGRFLIPGFWDMHVHLNRDRPSQEQVMLPLMIANGVTGVRDMLSDCWEPCPPGRLDIDGMRALQQEIASGSLAGPRIIALSSPLVSGHRMNPSDGDPERWEPYFRPHDGPAARRVVRYLQDRQVDFIKIYNGLPRAAFFALMDDASRAGLEVSGHLPWSVSPEEAVEAGLRTIEHSRFPALACAREYEGFRAAFARFAEMQTDSFPEDEFKKLRESLEAGLDVPRCKRILAAMARQGTYLVPTHTTLAGPREPPAPKA